MTSRWRFVTGQCFIGLLNGRLNCSFPGGERKEENDWEPNKKSLRGYVLHHVAIIQYLGKVNKMLENFKSNPDFVASKWKKETNSLKLLLDQSASDCITVTDLVNFYAHSNRLSRTNNPNLARKLRLKLNLS